MLVKDSQHMISYRLFSHFKALGSITRETSDILTSETLKIAIAQLCNELHVCILTMLL